MNKKIGIYVNNWIFGNCELINVVKRIAAMKFDGIELLGEPLIYDSSIVNKVLGDYGLEVISVCGMYPGSSKDDLRALSHPQEKERLAAIDYVKKCIDLAKEIGARSVLVVPSLVGQPDYFVSKKEDCARAVDSLAKTAEFAERMEIFLTIEPINRYEVGLVNTVEDSINMAKEIGNNYIRAMGDTFHMQMEEVEGIANAIRSAGKYWFQHLHIADNNREAPGLGILPWRDILRALIDINYEGGISCEPLPRGSSPYDARNGNIPAEILDKQLNFARKYLESELEAIMYSLIQ